MILASIWTQKLWQIATVIIISGGIFSGAIISISLHISESVRRSRLRRVLKHRANKTSDFVSLACSSRKSFFNLKISIADRFE